MGTSEDRISGGMWSPLEVGVGSDILLLRFPFFFSALSPCRVVSCISRDSAEGWIDNVIYTGGCK